jgi:hypothetical protein
MVASQNHGFILENEILSKVFKITDSEKTELKYTDIFDLPKRLNKIGEFNLSIKSSGNLNCICMSDCLRIFDIVSSEISFHLILVNFKQVNKDVKNVVRICEIDLTNCKNILFGDITRKDIIEMVDLIKKIPAKRNPSKTEHEEIYNLKNKYKPMLNYIRLDIKCNSTQSRLQCSFVKFNKFLEEHSEKIVEFSFTNSIRNVEIVKEIFSGKRKFTKNIVQ